VFTRLTNRLGSFVATQRFDAALGIALFALAEVEAAHAGELAGFGLAVPFFTLTLAWRRRAPLLVALGASAAVIPLAFGPEIDFPSNAALAGVCGITYSAGAHLPRREAILALGAVLVSMNLQGVLNGNLLSGGDWIFVVVMFTVPWAIGRIARRLREREEEIARTIEQLESERERTAELAVAAERLNVARELHDTVAALLNLVVVQGVVAEQRVRSDPDMARDAIALIRDSGRRAGADLQQMLAILRPEPGGRKPTPSPGLDRVPELVELARDAGVEAELSVSGARNGLPAGLDLSAYRIVQEALSNVAKHAAGARADVCIRYLDDAVVLEVRDGGGMRAAADSGGHGLAGMRERAAIFGGQLDAAPTPDGGFAVRARLPLEGTPA
jgi:signal transduction histidine kinase